MPKGWRPEGASIALPWNSQPLLNCPSSVKNWVKGLLLGTRCWNPESCWLIFSYPMPRMLDLCHIMKWAKKTNSLVYLQYIYISSYGRKSGTNQQSWSPGVLQKDHISSSPVVHPMSNTFIQHSLKNSNPNVTSAARTSPFWSWFVNSPGICSKCAHIFRRKVVFPDFSPCEVWNCITFILQAVPSFHFFIFMNPELLGCFTFHPVQRSWKHLELMADTREWEWDSCL